MQLLTISIKIRFMLGPICAYSDMYWSRKSTWEWSTLRRQKIADDAKWFDCQPKTCEELSNMWAGEPQVGQELLVYDTWQLVHDYVVKEVHDGMLLYLCRKGSDVALLATRPVVRKLQYAEHDKENDLIR
jgi:hypothetical protein